MSKLFPTNKDHIIDELDEKFHLHLKDQEFDDLRKLTESQLLLITSLFYRAQKQKDSDE